MAWLPCMVRFAALYCAASCCALSQCATLRAGLRVGLRVGGDRAADDSYARSNVIRLCGMSAAGCGAGPDLAFSPHWGVIATLPPTVPREYFVLAARTRRRAFPVDALSAAHPGRLVTAPGPCGWSVLPWSLPRISLIDCPFRGGPLTRMRGVQSPAAARCRAIIMPLRAVSNGASALCSQSLSPPVACSWRGSAVRVAQIVGSIMT
jgi:hypothetical protein